MRLLTVEQMREADRYTIEEVGISALELMERAGRALSFHAEEMVGLNGKRIRERVLCVCGGGNNGGDGFVCARLLNERGQEADVVFVGEKCSEECAVNKQRFVALGGKILEQMPTRGYAVVVDCLLGTGFHGEPKASAQAAIAGINALKQQGAKVLSADIPSGVNGNNGSVAGCAVRADKTLCIGEVKQGVYLGDGIDYAGEVLCVDIGIELPADTYTTLLTDKTVSGLLPKRKRNSHKGTYGKAAIIAGSAAYTGAAYLSAAACLRGGAGYTYLYLPKALTSAFALKLPETLLVPLCEGESLSFAGANFLSVCKMQSIGYGMGMGTCEDVAAGAEYLIRNYTGKLVLDADGINSLAAYRAESLNEIFANKKCDVVLTPHVKEFSRISEKSVVEIMQDPVAASEEFAKKHGVTVLLKNAVSVITDGKQTCFNAEGNAGQAKGGSGDVLSGVITSLCACGLSVYDAARIGAYVTGRAAVLAAQKQGEYSLLASDVIAYLGRAFLSLTVAENADTQRNEE